MRPTKETHLYFFGFFLASLHHVLCTSLVHPGDRDDVIGHGVLANKEQCRRWCWYRQLCSSYSFREDSGLPNCFLHTDTVQATHPGTPLLAVPEGWKEYPASGSGLQNGCNELRCGESEVCVPRGSAVSCLPQPSQCGDPEAVSHGDVSTTGTSQDDVARVTCQEGYVASPKGVSVEMVCLVTSKWTKFSGTCEQYEFKVGDTSANGMYKLPWLLQDNATICIKGNYSATIQEAFTMNLHFTDNKRIHFSFRYYTAEGILMFVEDNGVWEKKRNLGPTPIAPGDSFNITIQVLSDVLLLTVNENHKHRITEDYIQDATNTPLNASQTYLFSIYGPLSLTYVNLISGCG